MTELLLIDAQGRTRTTALAEAPGFRRPRHPLTSRVCYAAAHVVPKAWADNVPGAPAEIDWDATIDFRRHVWSWGLGVADAMDTAQRNMGLDAVAVRELITRSAAAAREEGGALVVGIGTDHMSDERITLDQVIDAYVEQLQFAEDAGAGVVLMASRHLARAAESAEDYERVYRAVLARAGAPVVLHWLGTAFDPQLSGYFGAGEASGAAPNGDVAAASDTVIRIIEAAGGAISGVKMSLLDAEAEIALRDRLPESVRMFTGDDFNYVRLIGGDGDAAASSSESAAPAPSAPASARTPHRSHSDALLGAFAALAPAASAAVQALDAGDRERYRSILAPTEELSRQIFAAPTFYYKTGVAFLSWLNGHQPSFTMVGGLHAARSLPHLSRIVELANRCGALERPELAAARWNGMLAMTGVHAGDTKTNASNGAAR